MHQQGFGGSKPEPAAPAVEAEPSAAAGLAMADKSLKEPVAPPASPSAAPGAASDLAFAEKDELRQARPEKAKGKAMLAMPPASTSPEKEQGYAEEMPSKPAGAGAVKAEKSLQQAPEVLAQWAFNTGGGAPEPAQYEKLKKAEMKKSASGNYPVPAASPAPAMKTDRLMENQGREEFIAAIVSKYGAGLQSTDSAGFRIYTISISTKHLASFLDTLRTRGELRVSKSVLPKTPAENVTVILKTAR